MLFGIQKEILKRHSKKNNNKQTNKKQKKHGLLPGSKNTLYMKMKPKPMTWHDCVTPFYSGNATDAQYGGKAVLLVHCEYRIDWLRLNFHAFRRYKVFKGALYAAVAGSGFPRLRGATPEVGAQPVVWQNF